jgi:hypothetical protein
MQCLKNFKLKIKSIKTEMESLSEVDEKIHRSQKGRFERLGALAEEMEDCIKSSIKKVKI